MWSKRLADIRPETVFFYGLFLLLLGYARVIWLPMPELDSRFLGVEYYLASWIKWTLPVLWMTSAWLINYLMTEQFQILKRYSFIGFFWGLTMIHFGDFELVIGSVLMVVWFLTVSRIQTSKSLIAEFLDIGLFTGVMTLIDIRYITLLPLAWVLMLAYGRIRWRGVFGSIWGLVTVHILTAILTWTVGAFSRYLDYFTWPEMEFILPDRMHWVWLTAVLFWWILSLGNYFQALSFANIVKRQTLSAILFIQLGAITLWATGVWHPIMTLTCVPIGSLVFITNDLQYRKWKWWKEIVFWSMILLSPYAFS